MGTTKFIIVVVFALLFLNLNVTGYFINHPVKVDGHTDYYYYGLAWNPTGDKIVVGETIENEYGGSLVSILDLNTTELIEFGSCGPWIDDNFAWSNDGKYIGVGGSCKAVWDATTLDKLYTLKYVHSASIAFRSDSNYIAFGGAEDVGSIHAEKSPALRIADSETGTVKALQLGHDRKITAIAWSPDMSLIATGSSDDRLLIWEIDPINNITQESLKRKLTIVLEKSNYWDIVKLQFSPNSSLLFYQRSGESTIESVLLDVVSGIKISDIDISGHLTFNLNWTKIVSTTTTIQIYDYPSLNKIRQLHDLETTLNPRTAWGSQDEKLAWMERENVLVYDISNQSLIMKKSTHIEKKIQSTSTYNNNPNTKRTNLVTSTNSSTNSSTDSFFDFRSVTLIILVGRRFRTGRYK